MDIICHAGLCDGDLAGRAVQSFFQTLELKIIASK
jgi:hypothetical protein